MISTYVLQTVSAAGSFQHKLHELLHPSSLLLLGKSTLDLQNQLLRMGSPGQERSESFASAFRDLLTCTYMRFKKEHLITFFPL